MIKEACCEGFTEGINAEALGANRIELCSNLAVGGLSPSFNEVKEALKFLNIPVFVMVRPREWNFIYTKKEKELMIQEIRNLKNIKWIYVNILDTIFFVFYEYFFSNSIGLKYPNLL